MIRSILRAAPSPGAAILLLAALPGVSGAAIVVYNNQGDFNASLGATPTYTENFASLAPGAHPTGTVFNATNPALSFSAVAASTQTDVSLWKNAASPGSWIGTDREPSTLTFIFGSGGVSAVSGNFFITDVNEAYLAGTVSISINGGAPFSVTSVASGSQPFSGFKATGGEVIHSIAITPVTPPNPSANYYPTAANFTIAAIPEPSAAFLGLLSTAMMLRRRRRVK